MDLLQEVLKSLRPAVVAMIASAGVSILVSAFWNGADIIALADTRWVMVGIFVICLSPSSKNKMEPGTCDGVGWGNEVVGGDCGDWIKAGGGIGGVCGYICMKTEKKNRKQVTDMKIKITEPYLWLPVDAKEEKVLLHLYS